MTRSPTLVVRSLALLVTLAGGCATDSSEGPDEPGPASELTCEVIANSCWATAVTEARACAPGSAIGTLAADGRSCAFDDGRSASFDVDVTEVGSRTPLSIDVPACFTFATDPGSNTRRLHTASGEASWTIGDRVRLECPDGSTFETDTLSASRCAGFTKVTGFSLVTGADAFEMHLLADPVIEPLLSCAR